VQFQLLSASHRNLLDLVEKGAFREDLYYRLAGVEVNLPALRERSDRHELMRSLLVAEGGAEARLSPEAERLLMAYPWPGNVRQLRHVLRSACALADGEPIEVEHLPLALRKTVAASEHGVAGTLPSIAGPGPVARLAAPEPASAPNLPSEGDSAGPVADHRADDPAEEPPLKLNPILANERQVLLKMLEQHRWNVSNVAKAFDVSRNTLYRRLHKLHIRISHPD
jgi:sigma-54 dependent transcriptional regulator, acetoin dehydrogenase operon transcriptional activator AcoR